jgi:hypothetical protein
MHPNLNILNKQPKDFEAASEPVTTSGPHGPGIHAVENRFVATTVGHFDWSDELVGRRPGAQLASAIEEPPPSCLSLSSF